MVIVDASVVFKWFSASEESSDKALALLSQHHNQKGPILVPDLLLYEIANAWATKTSLPMKIIRHFLEDLEDISLKIETIDFKLLAVGVYISKKSGISLYDAIYVALAKQKRCQFITADQKLVSKVQLSFVKAL